MDEYTLRDYERIFYSLIRDDIDAVNRYIEALTEDEAFWLREKATQLYNLAESKVPA